MLSRLTRLNHDLSLADQMFLVCEMLLSMLISAPPAKSQSLFILGGSCWGTWVIKMLAAPYLSLASKKWLPVFSPYWLRRQISLHSSVQRTDVASQNIKHVCLFLPVGNQLEFIHLPFLFLRHVDWQHGVESPKPPSIKPKLLQFLCSYHFWVTVTL